jgi:hypothetical protein
VAPPRKTWRLLPHDTGAVERLAGPLRLSPLVAQLLLNRGVGAPDQARRFLDAPLNGLYPPDLLPGVTAAADRILEAIRQGRRLCVYGDYDVDGVSGSALLLQGLPARRPGRPVRPAPAGRGLRPQRRGAAADRAGGHVAGRHRGLRHRQPG